VSGMTGHETGISTAENYRRFARLEAAGRSPAYEQLAYAVAGDEEILRFLGRLPPSKRQPNLLFAAARYLLGETAEPVSLRGLVTERPDQLVGLISERRTQTNEAARCAVLLPVLASISGPLALIEVGAAAGLTLLLDCYNYDYAGHLVAGRDPAAPVLACWPIGPVPLPQKVPEVPWRAGLDLSPLDVSDASDVEWLSCLLWPGEEGRSERLAAAVATALRHPPGVRRGDLVDDLADLAAQTPTDATLVVYHSAVLAYVEEPKRREFADLVGSLGAVWISNEAPGVIPDGPKPPDSEDGFLLVRNGTELLARSDPHGTWIAWLA